MVGKHNNNSKATGDEKDLIYSDGVGGLVGSTRSNGEFDLAGGREF